MNKITPKQEELLRDPIPPHVDAESPALAQGLPPLGSDFTRDDDFDCSQDEAVIIREQRATAAYRNGIGELVIRQRGAWDDDGDAFVYISPDNEITFMEGLAKRAKDGAA